MPVFNHPLPLRFVEATDYGYSIYSDPTGADRYLADGTAVELFEFDTLDLSALWDEFKRTYDRMPHMRAYRFREHVESIIIDPDDHDLDDEIWICEDCDELRDQDETVWIDRCDRRVCDDCLYGYAACEWCEEYDDSDRMTSTLDEQTICGSCRDNAYFCDHCDGYYHQDSYEHDHDGDDCDCEAPGQRFRMRNGDEHVHDDESVTISLPDGFLSDEGVGAIANLLRSIAPYPHNNLYMLDEDGSYARDEHGNVQYSPEYAVHHSWVQVSYNFADAIGNEWQTRQGNYPKRLSRYAYKTHGLKLPADVMSQIGNIGRDHSKGSSVTIEFTRDLNQSAEDFYHEDSCWWQSYSSSRCSLKSNGGIGMRTFTETEYPEHDYVYGPWSLDATTYTFDGMPKRYVRTGRMLTSTEVTGRAWVMPVRLDGYDACEWAPTFESEAPDGFVIFNGYGDLSGYAPARIVAGMNGMTYRKVAFSCDPMYVNGDAGYLVTSEDLAKRYDDGGSVRLYAGIHSNLYHSEVRPSALANA